MEFRIRKIPIFAKNISMSCIENRHLLYLLALTRIRGIGIVQAKKLTDRFGDAAEVFRASPARLLAAGMPRRTADAIAAFDDHTRLEKELDMLQARSIRLLFFNDPEYPRRLSALTDAPPLLYYSGNADLNARRIVAVIGTRYPSSYGRQLTRDLVGRLASLGVLVISGLAIGVDAAAHEAALENNLCTVGVLGQGLRTTLYPQENIGLSRKMVKQGGLLTFFDCDEKAAPYNFPARNRLVAGLCDALVVVQTKRDGGSMLTVAHARKYKKNIFAVPGRVGDTVSDGCNWLIQRGDAALFYSAEHLAAKMGWAWPEGGTGAQATLEFGPAGDSTREDVRLQERLLRLIGEMDGPDIDELAVCSGLDASTVALALLQLELRGAIQALAGKRYALTSAEPAQ